MFRLFFWFFCIAIIALVLIGCGHVSSSVKITSFAYQDGYSWKYRCFFTGEGVSNEYWMKNIYFSGTTILANGVTVLNQYETDEASVAMTMAGLAGGTEREVSLRRAYPQSLFGLIRFFYGSDYHYYMTHGETGVYSYGSSAYPTTEARLSVPFPLESGTKWRSGVGLLMQAVAEEDVTVPAGIFRTIKVSLLEDDGRDSGFYYWYADGVGLVKYYAEIEASTTGTIESGKNTFTMELYSKNF